MRIKDIYLWMKRKLWEERENRKTDIEGKINNKIQKKKRKENGEREVDEES